MSNTATIKKLIVKFNESGVKVDYIQNMPPPNTFLSTEKVVLISIAILDDYIKEIKEEGINQIMKKIILILKNSKPEEIDNLGSKVIKGLNKLGKNIPLIRSQIFYTWGGYMKKAIFVLSTLVALGCIAYRYRKPLKAFFRGLTDSIDEKITRAPTDV